MQLKDPNQIICVSMYIMKRKASITMSELEAALKKSRISRKGANKVKKIITKGMKPSYGVKKSVDFGISDRDKKKLGIKGRVTVGVVKKKKE